jgi:hypothetical protein
MRNVVSSAYIVTESCCSQNFISFILLNAPTCWIQPLITLSTKLQYPEPPLSLFIVSSLRCSVLGQPWSTGVSSPPPPLLYPVWLERHLATFFTGLKREMSVSLLPPPSSLYSPYGVHYCTGRLNTVLITAHKINNVPCVHSVKSLIYMELQSI